jgi:SOS-response transcriptional repressor LexA
MYSVQIKIKTKLINRLYNFNKKNYILSLKQQIKPIEKFCVKILGNSMMNVGIINGSIVEITKNIQVYHNDIILAKVNGVHTIKRLLINHDNTYTLMPENIDFEPIDVCYEMDFCIEGVVTKIINI